MNTRNLLYGLIVIAIALVILAGLDKGPAVEDGDPIQVTKTIPPVSESDHSRGLIGSPVVLIEYGDFQCPACGAAHPIVSEVAEIMGDRVHFVYRHFPIRNAHPNAEAAARASVAASMQGMFWEMHDKLFESQADWHNDINPKSTFRGYAEELGLDMNQYESDVDSDAVIDKVADDFEMAREGGVNSTPSFYLGTEKVNPPRSTSAFINMLESALADAAAATGDIIELPAE